ncbi:MAG: hypothetical protein O7B81_07645 [Gammaproteobacteria bacterium]|nr:hypothetical protein [Gammaproteobacteria bacterium]
MLTLEQWAFIAEVASGIGVIASLIYLAVQIRQNSKMVAAQTFQSISSTSADLAFRMAENPEIANLMAAVFSDREGLTDEQHLRIDLTLRAAFRNFENYYYQFHRGFLEEDMWEGFRQTMLAMIHGKIGRDWWSRNKFGFGKRYREFIDREIETFSPPIRAWVGGHPVG